MDPQQILCLYNLLNNNILFINNFFLLFLNFVSFFGFSGYIRFIFSFSIFRNLDILMHSKKSVKQFNKKSSSQLPQLKQSKIVYVIQVVSNGQPIFELLKVLLQVQKIQQNKIWAYMLWKKLNKQKVKDSQSNKSGSPFSKQVKQQKNVAQKDHNIISNIYEERKDKKNKIDFYKQCINQIDAVYEQISPAQIINNVNSRNKNGIHKIQSHQTKLADKQINRLKQPVIDQELQSELNVIAYIKPNQKTSNFINQSQSKIIQSNSQGKSNEGENQNIGFDRTKFVSISLGRAKIQKNQTQKNSTPEQSLSIGKKKEDEQPLIIYSQTEVNQSQPKLMIKKIMSQDVVLQKENAANSNQMEQFFQQMRQAGIDISDLQSNIRSRQGSIQLGEGNPQTSKKNIKTNQIIQRINNNQQFRMKNQSFQHINNSMQQMKQITDISWIKKSDNEQKGNYLQIRRLRNMIISEKDSILGKKKQIQIALKNFEEYLFKTEKIIIERINQFQKYKLLKMQQSKSVQNLKYKVLELEAQILNKQVQISRQRQKIEQLQTRNQQLSQSYFDANQKLAQIQLSIKQQMQQVLNSCEAKDRSKCKQQVQIQRLNEEVQQLTRLYENSQNQYRASLQQQRITLTIQLQKIARQQTTLFQRQAKIEQKQFIIKQQQKRLKLQQTQINRRQEKIDQIQKTLSEKLSKVQELEAQLNEGFTYLEEVKKDNQQQIENIDRQRDQLIKELEKCQHRIRYLEQWEAHLNQRQLEIQANKYSHSQTGFYRNINSKQFTKSKAGVDDVRKFFTQANQDRLSNLDFKNLQKINFNRRQKYNQISHTDRAAYQSTQNLMQAPNICVNQPNMERDRRRKYERSRNNVYQDDMLGKIGQRSASGSGEKYSEHLTKIIKSVKEANSREQSPNSRNLKLFNQIISSSSANPLPSSSLIKKSVMQSKQIKPFKLKHRIGQKSPPSSLKKTNFNSKLSQLDSKIQTLRKQIKKQIHAARDN